MIYLIKIEIKFLFDVFLSYNCDINEIKVAVDSFLV